METRPRQPAEKKEKRNGIKIRGRVQRKQDRNPIYKKKLEKREKEKGENSVLFCVRKLSKARCHN